MRSTRRRNWLLLPLGITTAILLAACTPQEQAGFFPQGEAFGDGPVTNHTDRMTGLWSTSWTVLLIVGLIVWGLLLWALIVYRRRRGQTGLPVQMRYNMPIEFLYTVIPFILIIGFFAFTARDITAIESEPAGGSDIHISAFGKQWSWDFNYLDEDVHVSGVQAQYGPDGTLDGQNVPTLVLPVGKSVQVDLEARDVIHSFWVVDFLYKKDMIPGKTNVMYFTPTKEGSYLGKCAELCGEYHAQMLFKVDVVSEAEYGDFIAALKADPGSQGILGHEYDRNQNFPQDGIHSLEDADR
ncbi:MAG TPA: cytochrome c oxidase subunit II [Microbacteriaceae bacterium]|nr:cytochrome c oxidase subunit II [Microbacteriaceae bacterium]